MVTILKMKYIKYDRIYQSFKEIIMGENLKILSFDIGITSIGWAFVEGEELKDCGVRIFTKAENPKDGTSLATPRREARGVRRRLARRKARLNAIKRLLCKEFGLNLSDYFANDGELPKAYETTKDTKSPYELRSLALEQKLESKELARVILHIAKHRGYGNKHAKRDLEAEEKAKKAAEKALQEKEPATTNGGSKKDKEKALVLKALYQNETLLKGRTVGKYLYEEFQKKGQRSRNTTNNYQHTMRQEWLKDELEFIFKKQKEFGATFSENFESQILETAFYQRDLKSFEVGKCVFYENKPRAPKDSLSAMEFVALTRIINTLKNLEEKSKNLGIGETYGKDKIQEILKIVLDKGEVSYKKIREILHLDEQVSFGKDSKGKEAKNAKFIELKNLKAFKEAMGGETKQQADNKTKKTIEVSLESFDRKNLDSIATDIALIKSKENLAKRLQKEYPTLSKEQVEALSNLSFAKYINLSLKALDEILPLMREGLCYDEAVQKAGLQEHRKHKQKSKFLIPLKEYEPYLANPVVARALSEYRKVLNVLLREYGSVHKIHLEFTREACKSYDERKKIEKEQKEHFEANQMARQQCELLGLPLNGTNILKVKLWREQGECCVYSGKKITKEHLLDSNALQIDHIYPYSRSFDDSYMNKVLVFSKENQNKLNKTPYEAFGEDKDKWNSILSLSEKLPKQKQRRISNTNFKDKEGGFLARNINDTGYIARLASKWSKDCLEFLPLSENEVSIAGEKGSKKHIEVISGQLTSMLRHYWGLGDKNRDNHLHHAEDAIILAYANAKTIKAFADFRKNQEQNKAKFYAKQIAESEYKTKRAFLEPCKDFRNKVKEKIDSIFVSKPPKKRARGALHQETFYSFDDKELEKSYGGRGGIEKAIAFGKIRQIGTKIVHNGTMVRVDIFKDEKGKFYGVPIYTMDFALGILPNKAVAQGKDKDKVIKDWIEMDSTYSFCFSLFKDDLIFVQKTDMKEAVLCYYTGFHSGTAAISVEKHNNLYEKLSENESKLFTDKERVKEGKKKEWKDKTPEEIEQLEKNIKIKGGTVGIKTLKIFEKYQISPKGEIQEAKFEPRQNISLKTSRKKR